MLWVLRSNGRKGPTFGGEATGPHKVKVTWLLGGRARTEEAASKRKANKRLDLMLVQEKVEPSKSVRLMEAEPARAREPETTADKRATPQGLPGAAGIGQVTTE